MGEAGTAQRFAVGLQPDAPAFVRALFRVGRCPIVPAAEDDVEDVGVELFPAAEPVGAEGGDDLAGTVAGDAAHEVEGDVDTAPAVEDAEDRLVPGAEFGQESGAVAAGFSVVDFHPDGQVCEGPEAVGQLGKEMCVAGLVLLDEDQRDALPAEVHSFDCGVIEQAIEDEDGRAGLPVKVPARAGEGVKQRHPRTGIAVRGLQQDGSPSIQVSLIQAVLGRGSRLELP